MLQLRPPDSERDAESHAEEGGHEGEVVEVGEDTHLLRRPADERQLEHQDRERGQRDLQRDGPAGTRVHLDIMQDELK